MKPIDLRSDTVTRPTEAMRRAMAGAEVGDDVYGEDPTINRLEALGAEMVGHEEALFVASGTMGNATALLTHTARGDEILLESDAHIFYFEAAGAALLAGCQTRTIPGVQGILDPADVRAAVRPENVHFPRTGLLCLENTHNRAGGTVISVERTRALADVAHEHGVPVHLDGARVFNAAAAQGVPVDHLTAPLDSVQFCLSKGLAAPVGSLLAGSADFIKEARRMRKALGGGMRQAGIIAAAGIVALTEMVDRLPEDHVRARRLAEALAEMDPFRVDLETVQSNIIIFDVDPAFNTAAGVCADLAALGVRANPTAAQRIRFVTHYEITDADIDTAIDCMAELAHDGA